MKANTAANGQKFTWRGIAARVIIALLSWCIVAAVVMLSVPQKQSLKAGQVAPVTYFASREIVDELTTETARQEAVLKVPDKFFLDTTITADVLTELKDCYAAIAKVRENGQEEIRKLDAAESSSAYKDTNGAVQFTAFFLEQSHALLPVSLTDENLRYIIVAKNKELTALEEKVSVLVKQAMDKGIKKDFLSGSVAGVSQELTSPLNDFGEDAERLGIGLAQAFLRENFLYDAEGTSEARKKAADEVEKVRYRQGELIVNQGKVLTEAQVQVLKDLGLVVDESGPNILLYAGITAFTGILLLLLWLYLMLMEPEVFQSFRKLLLLSIIFVLTVALTWLGTTVNSYLIFTTAGVLMAAVLVSQRPAFIINALLALLAGLIAGNQGQSAFSSAALPVALTSFAGGAVSLFVTRRTPHRSSLMLAGILSGLISAAVAAAADLILSLDWPSALRDVGAGLGGGVVSSMICLGMLPLWEVLFKVVTPMRLLELGNPNHPLLKRLLIEAPGTYHHSIVVGNLAESAAEAVGANALMARTGAYYHDVGKLLRPYFFTENQIVDESPHESIAPELSKRILTAHTRDGVELAAKYGLPQQVQDIILEHHGTTPVMYFYHKAVKAADENDPVSLDDYRYAGPKPHTREAAIIMLADSIEAGARSIKEHTQEKLDEFVQHIVNVKLEDGQFDNCDLTLRDIGIISSEFRKVLGGIFHERVVYPTAEPQKKAVDDKW